jgi:hypothetical protein
VRLADVARDGRGGLVVAAFARLDPVAQLREQVLRPEAEEQHRHGKRQVGEAEQHVAEGPRDPRDGDDGQQHDAERDPHAAEARRGADPARAALEPVVEPAQLAQVQQPRQQPLQRQPDDQCDEIHACLLPREV